MRADRSRNKRKGILLRNNLHCFPVLSFFYKLKVSRDILMNGTSFLTRRHKTIQKRHLFFHLSGGQGFHRLHMMGICPGVVRQFSHSLRIYTGKYNIFLFQKGRHLGHSVISAGFQERSGNGHRPDARIYDLLNIVIIRPAGIGDAKPSVKLFRQLRRQRNRQRIQGFS